MGGGTLFFHGLGLGHPLTKYRRHNIFIIHHYTPYSYHRPIFKPLKFDTLANRSISATPRRSTGGEGFYINPA